MLNKAFIQPKQSRSLDLKKLQWCRCQGRSYTFVFVPLENVNIDRADMYEFCKAMQIILVATLRCNMNTVVLL